MWKATVVLIGMLVIRLPEVYPPIVRIRPSILAGTVIGILMLQHVKARAWRAVLGQPAVRWLAVYLGVIIITIPFSLWPGGAANSLYALPFFGLLFVSILMCPPTREMLDRLVRWSVLLGGVYAAYVMVFGHVYQDGLGGPRLGGAGMYDPNDLAVLMVIVLQLALGLVLRDRGLWRLISIAAAVAALVVALKTGSRGGVVALGVSTFTLLLGQKPARFFALSGVIAVAIPLMWMFGPESFRVRTASLLNIQNDYTFQTDAGRWIIWQRGLGYFAHRPLIGVGPAGYGLREGEYFASHGRTGAWLTAHNTYIQVLVELGIFGAIALAGMIWVAVRNALPLWRRPPPNAPDRLYRPEIFAALIGFLAAATFLSHAYNPLLFFSLSLATYAGAVYQAERGGGVPRGGRVPHARRRGIARAPVRAVTSG
ncbi:ligase [Gemmatimonadetes bacterium T265]|nr:ligase [Gemmatimonadetes bacterium T265]